MGLDNGQSNQCQGKSGQQIAKENVDKVHAYVEGLKRRGERIPTRGGQPNWTAIALACGFSRGVFYDNESARAVIEKVFEDKKLRAEVSDKSETPVEAGRAAYTQKKLEGSERHAQRLEERLAVKTAENEALKRRNRELEERNRELEERLRKLSAFEEVMAASGKRYIP
jgi:hypothetical protein